MSSHVSTCMEGASSINRSVCKKNGEEERKREMEERRQSDSCHGRVSGINKICFLYSSYCRSQATAA